MSFKKEWKKVTGKAKEKAKEIAVNFGSDKEDRAEHCLKYLTQEKGIKVCNAASGKEVLSAQDLGGIGVDRNIDLSHQKDYCLEEFQNKGFVRCDSLNKAAPVLNINIDNSRQKASAGESGAEIFQVLYDDHKVIKIPNTPSTVTVSIGKTVKLSGKEVPGCKFIVRDFDASKGAKLDFSEFKGQQFDDFYINTLKMNDHATKAIHAADVEPEFLVCLYDYDGNLNQDNFIFGSASQNNLHEDL